MYSPRPNPSAAPLSQKFYPERTQLRAKCRTRSRATFRSQPHNLKRFPCKYSGSPPRGLLHRPDRRYSTSCVFGVRASLATLARPHVNSAARFALLKPNGGTLSSGTYSANFISCVSALRDLLRILAGSNFKPERPQHRKLPGNASNPQCRLGLLNPSASTNSKRIIVRKAVPRRARIAVAP